MEQIVEQIPVEEEGTNDEEPNVEAPMMEYAGIETPV